MRNHFTILSAAALLVMGGCDRKATDGKPGEPQTIEQGLKQAGQAIEHGADKAGAALERGVEKARPTVERGVDKVGEMLEEGAAKAGPALERGVKKLGHALERGVEETSTALKEPSDEPGASAHFVNAEGVDLDGDAKLFEKDGKLHVEISVTDAPPGTHHVDLHETGDCSDLKGKSMGRHLHAPVDLGNIKVGDDGAGKIETALRGAGLKPEAKPNLVGKAIVIHAGRGDRGASSEAIACGVIK